MISTSLASTWWPRGDLHIVSKTVIGVIITPHCLVLSLITVQHELLYVSGIIVDYLVSGRARCRSVISLHHPPEEVLLCLPAASGRRRLPGWSSLRLLAASLC